MTAKIFFYYCSVATNLTIVYRAHCRTSGHDAMKMVLNCAVIPTKHMLFRLTRTTTVTYKTCMEHASMRTASARRQVAPKFDAAYYYSTGGLVEVSKPIHLDVCDRCLALHNPARVAACSGASFSLNIFESTIDGSSSVRTLRQMVVRNDSARTSLFTSNVRSSRPALTDMISDKQQNSSWST